MPTYDENKEKPRKAFNKEVKAFNKKVTRRINPPKL